MYKTVRQGENSLQYTILPQTEEVLSNSGLKGKGRDYSPSSHTRRINRKLMVYYLAILFFALLLTFGTLLFALVLCGIVPIDLPTHINTLKREQAALKTIISHNELNKGLIRKKELSNDLKVSQETSTLRSSNVTVQTVNGDSSANNNTTVQSDKVILTTVLNNISSTLMPNTEQEWLMPAIKRLQSSTSTLHPATGADEPSTIKPVESISSPYIRQRENNGDLMLDQDQINLTEYDDDDDDDEDYDMTKSPVIESTVISKYPPSTNKIMVENQVKTSTLSTVSTSSISVKSKNVKLQNKTALNIKSKAKLESKKYLEMKEHILDDDDEEYKEPLTDEDDVSEQIPSDDIKMSQAKASWLQTRWPFVDPSSYFQWTGYSARDNLLLPAILSAALSALLVLAILCYALRRRQRCKRRIQEIGNLTSDLQAEDNAILLTAENPSEED